MALFSVVCGAALLGLAGLWLMEQELAARAGESLALAATGVADKLDAMLRERDGDIAIIAAAPQVRSADAAQMTRHLRALQAAYPVYSRLAVTNQAGRVVASTDEKWVGKDFHHVSWYQAVWQVPRVHAETVREPGEVAGPLRAVVFSAPISDTNGTFLGVVMTEVDRTTWTGLVEESINQFSARTESFGIVRYRVLSHDGAVLLTFKQEGQSPLNLRDMGLPSAAKVATGRSGYVEEEHVIKKVPVVTGYARMNGVRSLESLKWGLLVRAERADVLASVRRVLLKIWFIGAVGFLLMLAAVFWANVGQRNERERSKQAELAHRESEMRAKSVIESALDAVVIMDANGHIIEWNRPAEQVFGWSREEALGRDLGQTIVPPSFREAHAQGIREYLATGEGPILNQRIEITAIRKNGSEFPVELTITPLDLEGGTIFSAFVRDITEHKEIVEQLKARETFFRQFAEQLPVGVFEVNEEGVCLFTNKMWDVIMDRTGDEIFGFASASLPEGRWVEWFHPDDRQGLHDEWMSAQASLAGMSKECRLDLNGPAERWVQVLLWPLGNDRGIRYLGTMEDITARRKMVARLQESEMFFRLLSEHLPIGVFEIDEGGRSLYTNKTLNTILRKDTEEIFGFGEEISSAGDWLEWFHADDRKGLQESWQLSKDSFAQVRQECRLAPDGSDVRWVQILLWPLANDKGFRYLGTVEDITARKQTIAQTMQLLRSGRFELHTHTEARSLAELLAYAFPDPSRTQLGLTELLVNGVEHGNLEISYTEKSSLLEEGRLDDEMSRRLALPENLQKRVWVSMERKETELEMTIIDDGKGFDWHRYLALDDARSDDSHGRGIAMSKCISFDRLEYRAPGNQVTVSTRLIPADPGTDEVSEREAA